MYKNNRLAGLIMIFPGPPEIITESARDKARRTNNFPVSGTWEEDCQVGLQRKSVEDTSGRKTGYLLRNATSSLSTGTPRAIFTRTTASNGFSSPVFDPLKRVNNSPTEFSRLTYSAAACVPKVVVPARIRIECSGAIPGTNPISA